jgi:hypothetical protein
MNSYVDQYLDKNKGDHMSQLPQNNELIIFLVVLAVLLIIVIALAAVGISRRNKSGRTLTSSTFGNDIEGGKDIGPASHGPADMGRGTRAENGEEPSRSGISRKPGDDGHL